MRVYRIPYSTNVERVALALAHKSMPVDWVDVDPDDRSAVVALSGQDLVPVLEADHGEVVADSMRIVRWLEKRRPDPPLWPASPGRHAEVDIFVEWFNRVWKLPPNAMAAELAAAEPDEHRLHDLSAELRGWLHLFEGLLDGRDWLMGEAFGAADVCAFPFLKYGVLELRSDDTDPFHRVLSEHLPIAGAFPEIEAWVHRVDALPRA
jgi:glutathione S-transferase